MITQKQDIEFYLFYPVYIQIFLLQNSFIFQTIFQLDF